MKKAKIKGNIDVVLYGPKDETAIVADILGKEARIFQSEDKEEVCEICGTAKIAISPKFHKNFYRLKAKLQIRKKANQIILVGDWIHSETIIKKKKIKDLKQTLFSD